MIVRVTGGLVAGGAVAGGICGALTAAVMITWLQGIAAVGELFSLDGLLFVAFTGSIGGAATPVLFWSVLRKVPFGEVLKLGVPLTVIGSIVGEWLMPTSFHRNEPPGAVIGAFAGFALAGIVARLLASRRGRAAVDPPAGEQR